MTDTAIPTAATAPAEPPLSVTIDGRRVAAEKGELIIAAAERAGVFIPRFCYHPRMKPVGMCRMCIVEVSGPRGATLQPACFVSVADGQEIVTDSEKVRKAQDGVLEFLLLNHPLDCPVCDKGGECPLQDQTLSYGPGESRFVEEKRHWAKPIPISDLVYLDRERCIQCARCTRFADEIAGEPLIDFYGRGDRIEVATFPGHPFASYFSGNTVQICPVGALTASPYRFKSRPWDLEQAETTCTTCSVGCRAVVQSSAGRLVRMLGIDSDPVNHGWLCDKGRFGFESVNSDSRLGSPLVRIDGELRESGWSEALKAAAGAITAAKATRGPEGVAVIGGARLTNEDAYAWAKIAKSVIGTDSVDAQLGDGLPAELVLGLPKATIDEACDAKAVLVLGPDLREELPVLFLRLRKAAVEDKTPLVELAPIPTALARYAETSISYRPGEAAAAVGALLEAAAGRTPSGDVAGVGAKAFADAGRVFGTDAAAGGADATKGDGIVVVLGRPSLAEGSEGIAAAAGAIASAWPGARFLTVLRRANVHGALDMGLAPGMLPGRVSLEEGSDWFGRADAWGTAPSTRGRDCHAILTAAAAGEIDALVLLGADPLSDFPDRDLADRALAGVKSVIAVDTRLTESTRRAAVVLPAAGFAEKDGTTTNCEGRVSRVAQKLVPPGVAWADWMIASELAFALGADLGFESVGAITDEIERLAPSHRGLTTAAVSAPLARDGVIVPIAAVGLSATGLSRRTAPGLIDPIANPGIDSVEMQGAPIYSGTATATVRVPEGDSTVTRPPLVTFKPPKPAQGLPAIDGYALRLVSRRHLYDAGALVQGCPSLAGLAAAARLSAHPADLDRLGVSTGDRVKMRSPRSEAVVEVLADPAVPRGVASLGFNLPINGSSATAASLFDSSAPVVDIRLETV